MSTASPIRPEEDQPKTKRQTKQKEYVPKKGSANYAFLICMAKGHKLGKEHFMKAELMQAAEDSGLAEKSVYGNPEAAKDSHFSYDGWSNIKTLTNREPPLVKRWGNPVKVALTSDGEALANRLLETAVKEGQTEEVETAEAAAAVEIEEEEAEEEDDEDYKPDDAAKEAAADDAELDADVEADVDEGVDPGEVDDKIDAEAEARVAKADDLVEVGGKGGQVTVEVEEKEEEDKGASEKRPAKRAKKAKAADEDYVELSDEDAEEPAPKAKGKKAPPAKRTRAATTKKSRKAPSTDSDESDG